MKKLLLSAVLLAALTAGAQTTTFTPVPPVIVQPSASDQPFAIEEKTRFQACENIGGTGFFWTDTVTGNLWRVAPPNMEWNFLGSPRGANTGRRGTYQLLSDRAGGVYVLNADNGEGWWTDGTVWKNIGELRRVKKAE